MMTCLRHAVNRVASSEDYLVHKFHLGVFQCDVQHQVPLLQGERVAGAAQYQLEASLYSSTPARCCTRATLTLHNPCLLLLLPGGDEGRRHAAAALGGL